MKSTRRIRTPPPRTSYRPGKTEREKRRALGLHAARRPFKDASKLLQRPDQGKKFARHVTRGTPYCQSQPAQHHQISEYSSTSTAPSSTLPQCRETEPIAVQPATNSLTEMRWRPPDATGSSEDYAPQAAEQPQPQSRLGQIFNSFFGVQPTFKSTAQCDNQATLHVLVSYCELCVNCQHNQQVTVMQHSKDKMYKDSYVSTCPRFVLQS